MEFIVLVAFLVLEKLADTWFNYYQVKRQCDIEEQRIKNERLHAAKNEQEPEDRQIGFVSAGSTMREIYEEE